jgi:Kef-type K+ transport system membrane component KefB
MQTLSRSTFSDIRNYAAYFILIGIAIIGVSLTLVAGKRLKLEDRSLPNQITTGTLAPSNPLPITVETQPSVGNVVWNNLRSPLGILLTQIVTILIVARGFSRLFRMIGQPPVMGEMVAGIVLGPSVLGLFYHSGMTFLFPASSMETLRLLSQIGVVLFMFVVGMELNVSYVREKRSAAVMISHASIVVPFLLGTVLSLFLYPTLAPQGTSFNAFALFIGVAMSITAFPVLARILDDRGLSQTVLGSIAITCAAVDDVTAWCILALVIAIVKATGVVVSLSTILFALLFVLTMLFVIRPGLGRIFGDRIYGRREDRRLVGSMLMLVLLCALITETIGLHALFGAFMAGVIMPASENFRTFLKDKIESFSATALLPLFFAFTGLRTEIGLLSDWNSWAICLLIILVATTGKLVGSMLMSRWTGMNWSNSFAIGVLMNTRGLVELVVLNIGYDLGILSGRIFAMMVIMALVTTFVTGPLLSIVIPRNTSALAQ